MGLLEGTPETIVGDMGVDLGGGERCVSEHLLHAAQVGTSLQQMGGHRMPQAVRPQVRSALHQTQGAMHDPADHPRVDPAASLSDEDGIVRTGAGEETATLLDPGGQGTQRGSSQRHGPFLVPFAQDTHHSPVQVHVASVQPAELGDADAGGVQQFEHGDVAQRDRSAAVIDSCA